MSDDPSPSSAARLEDSDPDPAQDDDATGEGRLSSNGNGRQRSGSRAERRRKKKKKGGKTKNNPGLRKKLSFVTHLLKTLDIIVFAELSSLYYMEYVCLYDIHGWKRC